MNLNLDYTKGIFLLVLAVGGNFIAETLSCSTQKLLKNNIIAKQSVLFIILYFAINFSSNTEQHPLENLKKCLTIWVCFLMFTKMHLPITIVTFILLCIIYFILNYENYYKSQNNTEKVLEMKKYSRVLYYLIIVCVGFGFFAYVSEKTSEYGNKFDIFKFILGKVTCDSII